MGVGGLVLYYTKREAGAAFAPGFEPFCASGFSSLAFNLTSDRFEMRCAAAPNGSMTGAPCGPQEDLQLPTALEVRDRVLQLDGVDPHAETRPAAGVATSKS